MIAVKSTLAVVLMYACVVQCSAQLETQCAFQVFGDLPCKSVSVQVTKSRPTTTIMKNAPFSGGEAEVRFSVPFVRSSGGTQTVFPASIQTTFLPYYQGCDIDVLTLGSIGSGSSIGECFTVKQRCPGEAESIFGQVYVDLWCQEPALDPDDYDVGPDQGQPFRVGYTQSSSLTMGEGC